MTVLAAAVLLLLAGAASASEMAPAVPVVVSEQIRSMPLSPLPGLGLPRAPVQGQDSPLTPPAPPCTPEGCVALPEPPVTGAPIPGNMAYWGGRVQVRPKTYLVLVGWGKKGAFTDPCSPTRIGVAPRTAVLRCDPHGAGALMADFLSQMGGTEWAGTQTQYYQVVNGVKTYIANDRNQLGGIWVDDLGPFAGKPMTADDMAQQAYLAAVHFKVPKSEWINSDFVIAQPPGFSDPAAPGAYCAFHSITSNGIPFVNMPYVRDRGAECGANLVNDGSRGELDGVTIVLGHEVQEVITDPDLFGFRDGRTTGGWYDVASRSETGDKCAYVGAGVRGVPGGPGNIKGNRGGTFAVQSLWSNNAAGGAGYCVGAGNDLPF